MDMVDTLPGIFSHIDPYIVSIWRKFAVKFKLSQINQIPDIIPAIIS